ncbi:MAG TPA: flagellar export protein FliJ [Verrucomicrobiae bacterium]|jgi:flagellar export protein FliJ|nr:flagellar export protein FliJ [Verrucomicrobiae bacterium]
MALFRFRLASVLRYRERRREDRRLELRDIEQAKEAIRSEIERLEERLGRIRGDIEVQSGQVVSLAELQLGADFAQAVAARIRERRRTLSALEGRAVAKRTELLQANRDVKTLEQLRERRRERHRLEEARAEQKLIDEVGQRRMIEKRQ